MNEPTSWRRDRWFWLAVIVGVLLRALPLLVWGWSDECVRDECIFRDAARPIIQGRGLGLAPAGWLPAPLYPYLLAMMYMLSGKYTMIRWLQVALTPVLLWLGARLGERAHTPSTGRIMMWLLALHPTLIFYAGSMWTETIYTILILAILLAVCWAREGRARRTLLVGALVGLAALLRGIASYMLPIIILVSVLSYGGVNLARPWRRAFGVMLGWLLLVVPYSIHASIRWGGPVLTDATSGHVAWLGNSDFTPITYDYALGPVTRRVYMARVEARAPPCRGRRGPLAQNQCMIGLVVDEISEHPWMFFERIPLRLTQLLNPTTFLTRHIRWHFWPGMPFVLAELIVLYQALVSLLVIVGGSMAMVARGRGMLGLTSAGIVLYHVAVICCFYGLSRFRLPLEPIALLWLAAMWTDRQDLLPRIRSTPWRFVMSLWIGVIVARAVVQWLPTAWPGITW